MKSVFEKDLSKQGFSFQETSGGYYNIVPKNRIVLPTKLQLVNSKPINLIIHGSQNGNILAAVGYFHFRFLQSDLKPDYLVFAFQHLRDDSIEYMVIPTGTLRERLTKNIIRSWSDEYFELRLWLIDGLLYDTTNFSLEGE